MFEDARPLILEIMFFPPSFFISPPLLFYIYGYPPLSSLSSFTTFNLIQHNNNNRKQKLKIKNYN
jgi:hypothetical protein